MILLVDWLKMVQSVTHYLLCVMIVPVSSYILSFCQQKDKKKRERERKEKKYFIIKVSAKQMDMKSS